MAGPHSFSLQAFRFGLYVALPIVATVAYSDPNVMHAIITKLNYIMYPPAGPRPPTTRDDIDKFIQK